MPRSILNPADPGENENGSEDEFQSGLGACNLDKIFNNVMVSFPIFVKNLTRFCHKRWKTVNMVVDTPWIVQEGYFPKYCKSSIWMRDACME